MCSLSSLPLWPCLVSTSLSCLSCRSLQQQQFPHQGVSQGYNVLLWAEQGQTDLLQSLQPISHVNLPRKQRNPLPGKPSLEDVPLAWDVWNDVRQQRDPAVSHCATWSNGTGDCHRFTGTGLEVEVLLCAAWKGSVGWWHPEQWCLYQMISQTFTNSN